MELVIHSTKANTYLYQEPRISKIKLVKEGEVEGSFGADDGSQGAQKI